VTIHHAQLVGFWLANRAPFDRILIAQTRADNLWPVSNEKLSRGLGFSGFGDVYAYRESPLAAVINSAHVLEKTKI
jgi:hypothetical protein